MHTSDNTFTHWLQWFYNPDSGRITSAFRLADGRAGATDGRTAVIAAYGERRIELAFVDPKISSGLKVTEYLARVLESPAILGCGPATVTRAGMLAMFPACKTCLGSTTIRHTCNCKYCKNVRDADDTDDCPTCNADGDNDNRPVTLWGTPVDANRVAYLLAHAPASDQYTIKFVPSTNEVTKKSKKYTKEIDTVLVVEAAAGWHAVIAPMDARGDCVKSAEANGGMREVMPAVAPALEASAP